MVTTPASRVGQAFVVLNPVAGRQSTEDVRATIERCLGDDWECDIYETTGEERLDQVVRAAAGRDIDLVIAAGGDGTISNVAYGLAHTEMPFAIIPLGTANVLAQELGIPASIEEACRLINEEHQVTRLDAMQVNDRLFVLHIGIGIESLMIRDTRREAKRRFGRLAYMWTGIRWLIGYQPRRFTIVADDKRIRPRASQVLVANGGTLGMRPLRWGPDIHPDDGHVDICIVNARTLVDYLRVAWHIIRGKQRRTQRVRCLTAHERISISSDADLPIQGDGEIIGETPLTVRVVPHAISVIVPASRGQSA